MKQVEEVFAQLARSKFRSRIRLGNKDRQYALAKGTDVVREHARSFIAKRLAPAQPANDGRQTPWRGHPVFVAQHATATCCRSCLENFHGIAKGRELTEQEFDHVVESIMRWLESELPSAATPPDL